MLIFMLSYNAVYFEGGEAQLERLTLNVLHSQVVKFAAISLHVIHLHLVLRMRACVRACVCVCVRACVRVVFVFVDTRLIDCADLKTKVRVSFIV